MSSKHLSVQLFPAPESPVTMMRRSRSPISDSECDDLADGFDKLHGSVRTSSEDVDGTRARVAEDEEAIALEAELIDRFLEGHRLGAGPVDGHHWSGRVLSRLPGGSAHRQPPPLPHRSGALVPRDSLLPPADLLTQM